MVAVGSWAVRCSLALLSAKVKMRFQNRQWAHRSNHHRKLLRKCSIKLHKNSISINKCSISQSLNNIQLTSHQPITWGTARNRNSNSIVNWNASNKTCYSKRSSLNSSSRRWERRACRSTARIGRLSRAFTALNSLRLNLSSLEYFSKIKSLCGS